MVSSATVATTTEAPLPHHHHHHHHQHHHKHGHPHHGNDELSEDQQPETAQAREHPAPRGLHRHHKLKNHQRQGHPENWDMPAGSENLQLPVPQKKLWRKGCINQLLCKLPKVSGLAPSSWCWHCRHLIFEKTGSAITWQCKETLPSLCSWQGLLAEENVIESWQWRLPPAAWQASQQLQPTEASTNWSWKNKAKMWKWPSY